MFIINDFKTRINELSISGYQVKIEQYISKGYRIFRKKPELFIIFTALFLLSMPFGGFLLVYPFSVGFFIAAHRLESNKTLLFEHFFDGFKDFIQLTLLMIVQTLFIFLGFLALIIPGIYLSVAYYFAPFFIIFGKMEFREALESSRRMVHKEWFSIFGFILVLGILNFLGVLAFGVGVLFTLPISFCATYVAFDDIINEGRN